MLLNSLTSIDTFSCLGGLEITHCGAGDLGFDFRQSLEFLCLLLLKFWPKIIICQEIVQFLLQC